MHTKTLDINPEGMRPLRNLIHRPTQMGRYYYDGSSRKCVIMWTGLIWLRIETSGGLL
jgi:hypothetical protein